MGAPSPASLGTSICSRRRRRPPTLRASDPKRRTRSCWRLGEPSSSSSPGTTISGAPHRITTCTCGSPPLGPWSQLAPSTTPWPRETGSHGKHSRSRIPRAARRPTTCWCRTSSMIPPPTCWRSSCCPVAFPSLGVRCSTTTPSRAASPRSRTPAGACSPSVPSTRPSTATTTSSRSAARGPLATARSSPTSPPSTASPSPGRAASPPCSSGRRRPLHTSPPSPRSCCRCAPTCSPARQATTRPPTGRRCARRSRARPSTLGPRAPTTPSAMGGSTVPAPVRRCK